MIKVFSTIFNFHHSVRIYFPSLFFLIIKSKPDIIFINNEPWSSTAFQVVLFCHIFIPEIKIVIYTCENLIRKYPLPFRWWEKFVLRNINLVLTLTQRDSEIILRKKGYNGKIAYLPLSVDTNIFKKQDVANLRKSIIGDSKLVIGYIGRLVKEKGVDLLIKAVKEINYDYHLLIIGNGSQKQQLINLVEKTGLTQKISFLSHIFYTDLPKYLNCLDILVLPSRTTPNWKEQFGRILIEAMSCGVSVIGSSSGEIPYVIGDAGLVFKEGNLNNLIKKISILAKDTELRRQLGKLGRQKVIENYNRMIVDQNTYKIYKEVLNESSC